MRNLENTAPTTTEKHEISDLTPEQITQKSEDLSNKIEGIREKEESQKTENADQILENEWPEASEEKLTESAKRGAELKSELIKEIEKLKTTSPAEDKLSMREYLSLMADMQTITTYGVDISDIRPQALEAINEHARIICENNLHEFRRAATHGEPQAWEITGDYTPMNFAKKSLAEAKLLGVDTKSLEKDFNKYLTTYMEKASKLFPEKNVRELKKEWNENYLKNSEKNIKRITESITRTTPESLSQRRFAPSISYEEFMLKNISFLENDLNIFKNSGGDPSEYQNQINQLKTKINIE